VTATRLDELLNRPHPGQVALACVAVGWRVIPLDRNSKRPIMRAWPERATRDPDEVLDWWSAGGRYAGALTGVATGPGSGVWVLDVDRHERVDAPNGYASLAALEAEHGPLPRTFTVRTPSGGEHRYFAYPTDGRDVVTRPNTCGPGLDTRGLGGQVVAPATWSGVGEYRVVDAGPVAAAPAGLLELVERRVGQHGDADGWDGEPARDVDAWLDGAATVPDQEQEYYLFRFASSLRGRAVAPPEVYRLCRELVDRFVCYDEHEPWTHADADYKARSVIDRYPAGRSSGDPATRPVVVPSYPEVNVSDAAVEAVGDGGGDPPRAADVRPPDAVTGTGADNPHRATDRANGIEVARFLDGRVLWTPESGWFVFDGRRWAPDVELVRTLLVGEFTDLLRRSATSGALDQDAARTAMDRANRIESAGGLDNALRFSQSLLAVSVTRLDGDPWLLNCPNGTLDLRTGSLRNHDARDMITRICPTPYDPDARDATWERTLREALEGDEARLRVMARFAGYTLTGQTTEKRMLVISGPTNTGKSTVTEPLYRVLGQVHDGGYATTWDADVVQADARVNRGEKLNKTRGARLVLVGELEKGSRMADGFVKQFTGGDTMDARSLYANSYSLRPTAKLWMATNYVPQSPDPATQGRLLLLPFLHTPPVRDPRVKQHLEESADAHRAILAWAVTGCTRWRGDGGFGVTPWLEAARAEYALESDPVLQFVQDELVRVDQDELSSHVDEVWKAYAELWGPDNQQRPLKRRALESALRERGLVKARVPAKGGTMRWVGYRTRLTVSTTES
jgi:P4 family phage/plasmid primase-like protien